MKAKLQFIVTASLVAVSVIAVFVPVATAQVNVTVTITTDNAYGFGFGDVNGIITYFGGIRNTTKEDIYDYNAAILGAAPVSPYLNAGVGAEIYNLNSALLSDYVYIVAWSDNSAFQGALAGFQLPNGPLLSGAGIWEVFATGSDLDSLDLADTVTVNNFAAVVNPQIVIANGNSGGPGTSKGWVDENGLLPDNITPGYGELAIGPPNLANALFMSHDQIDGISNQSRWMWYDSGLDTTSSTPPFSVPYTGFNHHEFLIFRTQIEDVPEPSTFVLLTVGLLGLLSYARRRRK